MLFCLLAAAIAGCSGGTSKRSSSPAALKLQRDDLAVASHALASVQAPVALEVSATKAAWPLIANGLPREIDSVSGSPLAARAAASAAQLRLPTLFGEAQVRSLTGPAAQLAGLFRSYALLSARGWKLLDAALTQIATGSAASARFARENAPLYIESIYDAHFTLAQIGKKLLAAYKKLGGSDKFGSTLSQAEVAALAQSYSEASDRLHPHVGVRLGS